MAWNTAFRRAIRVPDDLAIMGFNDQKIAGSIVPAITSVATPRREIGRAAAQMLVKQLQGQPPPDLQLDLGFKIVERQSMADDENSDFVGNAAEQKVIKGTAANSLSGYHLSPWQIPA
jgi:DNA-binding LacI/PurR family transcriptional regulator